MHREVAEVRVLGRRQFAVIYDGTCGLCSTAIRGLAWLDWRRKVVSIPNQTEDLAPVLAIPWNELQKSAWTISPRGHVYEGEMAVAAAVDALLPLSLPVFRLLFSLPVVHAVLRAGYRLVTKYRHRIPAGPPVLLRGDPPVRLPRNALEELARRGGTSKLLLEPA